MGSQHPGRSEHSENQATFSVAFNDEAGNLCNTETFTSDDHRRYYPPSLNLVKIESDNSVKSLAKSGDQISLDFRSLSPIETPRVMINGEPTHLTGEELPECFLHDSRSSGKCLHSGTERTGSE